MLSKSEKPAPIAAPMSMPLRIRPLRRCRPASSRAAATLAGSSINPAIIPAVSGDSAMLNRYMSRAKTKASKPPPAMRMPSLSTEMLRQRFSSESRMTTLSGAKVFPTETAPKNSRGLPIQMRAYCSAIRNVRQSVSKMMSRLALRHGEGIRGSIVVRWGVVYSPPVTKRSLHSPGLCGCRKPLMT